MILDWLISEGWALISWWLISLAAAWIVLPLCLRLCHALPSRGYAVARAAGILLIGYLFWLLNNLGLLRNTSGDTLLAALIVLALSLMAYFTWRERPAFSGFLRQNAPLIGAVEALFLILFVGWALVRALNPDLTATEKPMEMAFLSAVRRSAQFPPHDPWLSGYAISYYHFGYILIGTIANLSAVTNGMAFNLGIALLFALTGIGAFGVAYDLVAARRAPMRARLAVGSLAILLSIVMGNLGTAIVEIPFQTRIAPPGYLAWMNLEERDSYAVGCPPSGNAEPSNWCFWWWFRYSRVVRDLDLSGRPLAIQPITEMPIFSYVLADLHPHVLSMPFVMLTLALALNLVLGKRQLQGWELVLYGVYVGGMIFLNSWDAIFIAFIIGAEALRRLIANGTGGYIWQDWLGIAGFAAAIIGLTALLYLPFFIGFRSQAGGFLPNVLWPTQFQQFFLQFGPFLLIFAAYLWLERRRAGATFNLRLAAQILGGAIAVSVAALIGLGILAWTRDDVRFAVFQVLDESGGLIGALPALLVRRLHGLLTHAALLALIGVVIARLFAREPRRADGTPEVARAVINYAPASGFALFLIGVGAVLSLAPDFIYLRDGFGVRINTIFKLWYQAWLLWSVAAAYALWSLLAERAEAEMRAGVRTAFAVGIALSIALGMIYPVYAITSRALGESGRLRGNVQDLTLDGALSMAQGLDEYRAIQCLARLATADHDVVAEATRERLAYRGDYGRVSALTGIPTLLGWDNHQGQWRGNTFPQANTLTYVANGEMRIETRAQAIATLYNSTDPSDALGVIERYGITYIFVGLTERRDFSAEGLAKFDLLPPVCEYGNVRVYSADSFKALLAARPN
jgi:YYY domain-containing protein